MGDRRAQHRRQRAARRCRAKRVFADEQEAARFADWLRRVHDVTVYPYQCDTCSKWHLWSIPGDMWQTLAGLRSQLDTAAEQQRRRAQVDTVETTLQEATVSYDNGGIIQAPQFDPAGPALQICGGCGQALPNHLPVCPLLPQAVPSAETVEAVNDEEKRLGEAV